MYALKKIDNSDLELIFSGLSDPKVFKYYGIRIRTKEDALNQMKWYADQFQSGIGSWWTIIDTNGNKVGAIGINDYEAEKKKGEIGFWLLPAFWGKRIIPSVIDKVHNYAVTQWDIASLIGYVESDNIASKRLLSLCGYKFVGTLKNHEKKDGRWIDLDVYQFNFL